MRPDAVGALASYVEREGVSSARIASVTEHGAFAIAECSAGDGSRWYVATDKYGRWFGWDGDRDRAIDGVATGAIRAGAMKWAALSADSLPVMSWTTY